MVLNRSHRWSRSIGMLLLATTTLPFGAVDVAQAQSSATSADAEVAGYRPLLEEAVKEYDAANYGEARALFLKAIALSPNARAYRGLGMAEFELRNYADCVASLEVAVSSQLKPLDPALRAESEQLLNRARNFVAVVQLVLAPSGTQVVLDGAPVALDPTRGLRLNPGDHGFEFHAPGFASQARKFSVKGGENERWSIRLAPAAVASEVSPASAAPFDTGKLERPRPIYKSPWLWGGVGAVAVAVGVGLAVGLSGGGGGSATTPGALTGP
jgi:hypothetical protein